MSIFNRGGYWHYDFVVKGQRYRGTTRIPATAKRPPEAATKLVAAEREKAKLGTSARKEWTLAEVADRWFESKMEEKRSAVHAARRLKTTLRLLGPDTPITEIDAPEIEEAIQRRRREPTRATRARKPEEQRFPSNATVNRDLIDTTLRPIFRYAAKTLKLHVAAIEWGELRREEPQERVRSFTPAELDAWREALPAWHWPISDILSRYGLRLREAFFPPSAFDGQRITIPAKLRKNGKPLVVPILPDDRAAMAERVKAAREAGFDTVWIKDVTITRKDGVSRRVYEPIHWRGYQSASAAAAKRAGLVDARAAHDFRHHAATTALRRTGNLPAVGKMLGHSNIASTARYAHVYEADVLEALGHKESPQTEKKAKKPIHKKGSGV